MNKHLGIILALIIMIVTTAAWHTLDATATADQAQPQQPDNMNVSPRNTTPLKYPTTPADAQNVELVAHFGGQMDALAVDGHYAYVGQGPSVTILDLSDPTAPTEIGRTVPLAGPVDGVVVAGGYAYVTVNCCRLLVIDVTNPAAPAEVGSFTALGYVDDLAVNGDNVFLAVTGSGLQIVDVTDPTQPVDIGRHDTPGTATAISLNGTHAYIADISGGVRVFDVAEPANPQEIGFYPAPSGDNIRTVASFQDLVFAGGDYGFHVLDVSNPMTPTEVGFNDTISDIANMALTEDGAHLVLASGADGVRIVDVTNPANPFEAGSLDTEEWAIDVAIAGDRAYVTISVIYNGHRNGLAALDIAAPAAPTEVSFFDTVGTVNHMAVAGDYAYLATGIGELRIMSVADPAAPREIAAYDTLGSASKVVVDGDTLYVADGYNGLLILDVADPATPHFINAYDTFGMVVDIVVVDEIAYVADYFNGLRIIDVSDPTQPAEIGYYNPTSWYAFSLTITGNYAYINSGIMDDIGPMIYSGFSILDVSDPASPREVYSRFSPGYGESSFSEVVMVRNYAYLLGSSQIHLLDVTNPVLPVELPSINLAQPIYGASVAGEFLYGVGDGVGEDRLQILNVTAPPTPFDAGFYTLPSGFPAGVTVREEFVYLSMGWGGAMIFRFTPTYNRTYLPVAY